MSDPDRPRLAAGVFYGVIVAGLLTGMALAAGGAWAYREFGAAKPEGRGVFDGVAADLVLPVAVMAGTTFGGLAGLAAAVLLDRRVVGPGARIPAPNDPGAP